MCTGLEIAAAIGAVGSAVSTVSALQQASGADDIAKAQTQQAQIDADYADSAAQVTARNIRKNADRQRAEARASLASSGVSVDVGSAEMIQKDITAGSEQDALMAIYDGNNNAATLKQQGAIASSQSRNSATASRWGAATSALSGAATVAKGWNTSAKGR